MKRIIKITTLLFILIAAGSCSKDINSGNSSSQDVGYMTFEGMSMSVEVDVTPTKTGTGNTNTVAPDDFIITITNSKNEVVLTDTYGNIKNYVTPIAFKIGVYKVEATSPTPIVDMAWDAPTYYGVVSSTIISDDTTVVDDLICKLSNIKTSVTLQQRLKGLFKPDNGTDEDLKVTVSLDVHKAEFSRDETRAAFFKAQQASNTISITLSGMYNKALIGAPAEYVPVKSTYTIENVTAGQHRKISIKAVDQNDGSVNFEISVETWVYDENIDVDVASNNFNWGEEEFVDADNKTTNADCAMLTLDGAHNFTTPFIINGDIFTPEGICTDKISLTAATTGGATIEEFDVVIETSNAALTHDLISRGIRYNNIRLLPANNLSDYIEIAGNRFSVNDAGMKKLFNYEGTHKAIIITVDSQNRRSYNTLTITVSKQIVTGPSIEWLGGFDFGIRHQISKSTPPTADEFPVVIKVTSKTGITGFIVDINSVTITAATLQGIGLDTSMDLISPATPIMESTLMELGFPIKDNVLGQTSIEFDITSFMPMISMLGLGETDFVFKVTDSSGTVETTMKLNVVE